MKTIAEMVAWFKTQDHKTTVLIRVYDVPSTGQVLYLSSAPFSTSNTDSPPNTGFIPCVVGGITFNESMSLSNDVSISYGDVEIENTGGVRDAWLNYVWVNKSIEILLGDVTWNLSDFRIAFSGVIADISSRRLSTLNLIISSKLQKANNPISEELMPSTNTNSDILVPLSFGETFNQIPELTDTIINTLQYQVHNGPVENIIEVRDNGVPVSITKDLANGKFTLNQSAYGQITCSVQGHKSGGVYYNDIANIIHEILTKYGPVETRLTDFDIDLSNFGTFATNYPQSVGISVKGGDNILTVCNSIARSIGAQLSVSSTGLIRLVRLALPGSGTTYNISAQDIEEDSISLSDKSEVRAATKLGYAKNWATQEGTIAAGIPTQNVSLFESEYLFSTVVDSSVKAIYKLTAEPKEEPTLLNSKTAADLEAIRRNALWSVPRYVYTVKGYGHLFPIELGDTIVLTDSRFGLSGSKSGIAVSIARNWLNDRITVGVLV